MTVYVDDFRVLATVGRIRGRWSHLTADTQEELHEFIERLGMRREWFQEKCKTKCVREGQVCPHWHYDVLDPRRLDAIRLGAQAISLRQMGELIIARRVASMSVNDDA